MHSASTDWTARSATGAVLDVGKRPVQPVAKVLVDGAAISEWVDRRDRRRLGWPVDVLNDGGNRESELHQLDERTHQRIGLRFGKACGNEFLGGGAGVEPKFTLCRLRRIVEMLVASDSLPDQPDEQTHICVGLLSGDARGDKLLEEVVGIEPDSTSFHGRILSSLLRDCERAIPLGAFPAG